MQLRQIIVLKHKGRWVVRSHGTEEAPFATQVEALKSAVELAHQSGKDGTPAKVMLVDIKKSVAQPFWTYGEDSYPP